MLTLLHAQQIKSNIKNTNVYWEDNKKIILSNKFIIPVILFDKIYNNEIKL